MGRGAKSSYAAQSRATLHNRAPRLPKQQAATTREVRSLIISSTMLKLTKRRARASRLLCSGRRDVEVPGGQRVKKMLLCYCVPLSFSRDFFSLVPDQPSASGALCAVPCTVVRREEHIGRVGVVCRVQDGMLSSGQFSQFKCTARLCALLAAADVRASNRRTRASVTCRSSKGTRGSCAPLLLRCVATLSGRSQSLAGG